MNNSNREYMVNINYLIEVIKKYKGSLLSLSFKSGISPHKIRNLLKREIKNVSIISFYLLSQSLNISFKKLITFL